MSVDMAMAAWESLERLAGSEARVHLTGGEPFMYFDRLAEIVDSAQRSGLRGPETIETNAFWATNDAVIHDQLAYLSDRGMERLKISWDPFHAEFIDERCVQRLVRTARSMFDPSRVLVRWEKYLQDPVTLYKEKSRQDRWRAAVKDSPCRFTGRAAGELAELLADKPAEAFEAYSCLGTFLSAKGVHIDPYGNVFSGLCSGIIVGDLEQKTLEDIWKDFHPLQTEIVATLGADSPYELMRSACAQGFEPPSYFAGKCHLCACVRKFFFDNGLHESIIGPGECYGRRVPGKRRMACE